MGLAETVLVLQKSLKRSIRLGHEWLAKYFRSQKAALEKHASLVFAMADEHFSHADYIAHGYNPKDIIDNLWHLLDIEKRLHIDLSERLEAAGILEFQHYCSSFDNLVNISRNSERGANFDLNCIIADVQTFMRSENVWGSDITQDDVIHIHQLAEIGEALNSSIDQSKVV